MPGGAGAAAGVARAGAAAGTAGEAGCGSGAATGPWLLLQHSTGSTPQGSQQPNKLRRRLVPSNLPDTWLSPQGGHRTGDSTPRVASPSPTPTCASWAVWRGPRAAGNGRRCRGPCAGGPATAAPPHRQGRARCRPRLRRSFQSPPAQTPLRHAGNAQQAAVSSARPWASRAALQFGMGSGPCRPSRYCPTAVLATAAQPPAFTHSTVIVVYKT